METAAHISFEPPRFGSLVLSGTLLHVILLVFVVTIPARTPMIAECFRHPVIESIPPPPLPHCFMVPAPVCLLETPIDPTEFNFRLQAASSRPAWSCFAFMTFACLHSELDKAVFASYVWQVHIQDTAVVPIAVLCLFLYLIRNQVRAWFRKRSST